jgi:hypothetical protein
MYSSLEVSVTLHQGDASQAPIYVLVRVNQHGQLPAVLVDPIDTSGRTAQGIWLGENIGEGIDDTTYARVGPREQESPSSLGRPGPLRSRL